MASEENKWMQNALEEFAGLGDVEYRTGDMQVRTAEEFCRRLEAMIAYLIDHDFEKLLWILYRIDVEEEKAKALLAAHAPGDAPAILSALILQRLQKKEEVRRQFSNRPCPDEDSELLL